MISQIIKRDGTLEPFSPEKLNGWGEWAAKTLGGHVDWSTVVMNTVASLPEVCSSETLQKQLIQNCLDMDSWSHTRMAGRLYASSYHKELYGKGTMPTVKEIHQRLFDAGFMVKLDYSDEEYAQINKMIQHTRDFKYAHFQLDHVRYKYTLRNRITGEEFETPQFVFMRMAMALAEDEPKDRRLNDVLKYYDHFAKNRVNAPTPNYVNLGTSHNGYASCCLYTTLDTAASLGIGDHIAYTMTVMSAGIGSNLQCRSIGDPVRGGLIKHQGKLPYYRAMVGAVRANMQNGRAGACTTYYSAFDPEVETLMRLKNPNTVEDKKIRGMDYAQIGNKFLGRKAARDEQIFLFNAYTAPDLFEAFYGKDPQLFEDLYIRYEADPAFKKTYASAREIVLTALNEGFEVGRSYLAFADEMNRHTPFLDPIVSSNLCAEILEPTRGYENMQDLYTAGDVGYVRVKAYGRPTPHRFTAHTALKLLSAGGKLVSAITLKPGDVFEHFGEPLTVEQILEMKHEPEVALCSLGGIVVGNIDSEEQYEDAMYYCLKMIDKCIFKSHYALPHIGFTAKNRLSAGVGIMGLAHYLAKKHVTYSSPEGKAEIHRVAERHAYYAIKASLRLGKELGNAPWMHRTKWPEGWLPIDTYQKAVDQITPPVYHYDWETLRAAIIENGGIRNSTLIAHMPGESSTKAAGTTNGVYPVRETTMIKTDNNMSIYWAAPDSEKLAAYYESAWDILPEDLIDVYGIIQKFTDQSISADEYARVEGNAKVTDTQMLSRYFRMLKVGMKTRYYMNTKTTKQVTLVTEAQASSTSQDENYVPAEEYVIEGGDGERGCAGGFCTL